MSYSTAMHVVAKPQAAFCELPGGGSIVAGGRGDHRLVLPLLQQVHQLPLVEDFQSRTDEPSYSPSDRLLVKRGIHIIGHVHVGHQIGWFHGQRFPLVSLHDFALLPEYLSTANRPSALDTALLSVAEKVAIDEGASLGLILTERPEWFEQHGWSRCRGQGHSRASTCAILAHSEAQWTVQRRVLSCNRAAIEVRTWRHFELDCLRRIYGQISASMWGPLLRNEEAWQWLVGRKAHDQILLAIDQSLAKKSKRTRLENDCINNGKEENHSHIEDNNVTCVGEDPTSIAEICDPQSVVGYAVVRDSSIVEMLTLPDYTAARAMLVARACREAIDRDHHFVSLHTPAGDPMHEVLVTAGGSWIGRNGSSGQQWMLKLLNPAKWIEQLYPVLLERVRQAGISRPLDIGLSVGNVRYLLTLTRRSSRLQDVTLVKDKIPCMRAACDWLTFQDILTSNRSVPEAIATGRLETAGTDVADKLAALFPPKLFWQSPFEMLKL